MKECKLDYHPFLYKYVCIFGNYMYKRWQNFSQFPYLQLIYLPILWVGMRIRMLQWRLEHCIAESFSSSFLIYFLSFCLQKGIWSWMWCVRDERESMSARPITFLGVQGRFLFPKTLAFLFLYFPLLFTHLFLLNKSQEHHHQGHVWSNNSLSLCQLDFFLTRPKLFFTLSFSSASSFVISTMIWCRRSQGSLFPYGYKFKLYIGVSYAIFICNGCFT